MKQVRHTKALIMTAIFVYAFYNCADLQITVPVLAAMIETQGYDSPTLSNLIVTLGCLAQIPSYILAGYLGERLNKRAFTYGSVCCLIGGSMLVIVFSSNLYAVLACRFIAGLGTGMLALISTAILPDYFEEKELSMAMGLVLAGSGLWGFVFSNLSGWIGEAYGWKASYLLFLYAVVPMVLFAVFVPGEPFYRRAQRTSAQKEQDRGIRLPVLGCALMGGVFYMLIQGMWSNISIWITDDIGGSLAAAGFAASVISLFSCVGRVLFGMVYNKIGRYILHLNCIFLICGMITASGADSMAEVLAAIAFEGLAMGFIAPAVLRLSVELCPENQVMAQAVTSMGFAAGNFLSTYWRLFTDHLGDGTMASAFRINVYFAAGIGLFMCIATVSGIKKTAAGRSN